MIKLLIHNTEKDNSVMFGQLNSRSLVSVFIARIHNQCSVYSGSTNNENPDQFALMCRLTWIYNVIMNIDDNSGYAFFLISL